MATTTPSSSLRTPATTTNPAASTSHPSPSGPKVIRLFNLKEWLETEVDVLGFFNVSNLIICLLALVVACCILCCVLFCVRYQFLKCKRKKEEYLEGRKSRAEEKKNVKSQKEAVKKAWDETIDQSTGASCYHNSVTGETTWEKPKGYKKKKKTVLELQLGVNPMNGGGPGGKKHVRTETVLPTGWASEFSPEGYKFYHNPDTGEVTWEAPKGATGGSAALLVGAHASFVVGVGFVPGCGIGGRIVWAL